MPYIWGIIAVIIMFAVIGGIIFLLYRVGVIYCHANMAVETQGGGVRWTPGVIRQRKMGGRFHYRFHKVGLIPGLLSPAIKISAPPPKLIAQYGKKSKLIFMKLHQTKDGKTYVSYINYYDKFTVPPSTQAQTYEFLAPVNENVMSWAIDECQETVNRYPFLMKHPHLVTAGVFMAGLVAMVMVVVTVNTVG